MLTRREFFRFFIIGGILSLLGKKVNPVGIAYGASDQKPKEAMFWRKVD